MLPPDDLPCSRCPVRDVGNRYPVNDERDPWRRMPNLFDRLVATFGRPMYNPDSRTRRETDHRVSSYCQRVRAIHGDDCSRERMRLCCTSLHEVAERAGMAEKPYGVWYALVGKLAADDALYGQLHRTRDASHVVDPGVVFRALDADVQ